MFKGIVDPASTVEIARALVAFKRLNAVSFEGGAGARATPFA